MKVFFMIRERRDFLLTGAVQLSHFWEVHFPEIWEKLFKPLAE
jgi:hypothetical protein